MLKDEILYLINRGNDCAFFPKISSQNLGDVGVVPVRKMTDDGKRIRTQLEIDFIATMGSKKYYLQSAFRLSDEAKINQEKASLLNVNDSFKKLIIVNDMLNVRRDDDGITTINVYDFLLDENSLDL